MGVFGGIIVGLGVAALHNRFYKIQLPNALSFFGGTRFVPIISTIVYMFVGILLYFVWPVVQTGIYALGGLVTGSGYVGTLIFGLIKRALIPFGLHHVFYMPFWQTAVGGTMEVAGQMVQGGQNIFFAQLADSANIAHFSADATRYFSGEFIFMIFGLPGAALAMYQCAKPEKKKAAGGLLLSAALACMATGITEPLEFSFLFRGSGTVCCSGCSGRYGIHDRTYAEYCRRTDFLRRSPRLLPVWYSSGKCKDKLDKSYPGWYYLFLLILFHFQIHDQKVQFQNSWS